LTIKADITQQAQINFWAQQTLEAMGRVDMVISNAGWTKFANFYDLNQKVDEAVWDRCFLANVNSHLFLLHTAKENLQNPNGAFVMTSSVAGVKAQWQLNCMLLPNLVHLAYV
jgi:NAD(P)-dependent dehydrogenase (short-subunit alcohol dehydrogenase family)